MAAYNPSLKPTPNPIRVVNNLRQDTINTINIPDYPTPKPEAGAPGDGRPGPDLCSFFQVAAHILSAARQPPGWFRPLQSVKKPGRESPGALTKAPFIVLKN